MHAWLAKKKCVQDVHIEITKTKGFTIIFRYEFLYFNLSFKQTIMLPLLTS